MSVIDVIEVQDQNTGESLGLGLVDSTALHILNRIEPLAAWRNDGGIIGFVIAAGNALAEQQDKHRRVNDLARQMMDRWTMTDTEREIWSKCP